MVSADAFYLGGKQAGSTGQLEGCGAGSGFRAHSFVGTQGRGNDATTPLASPGGQAWFLCGQRALPLGQVNRQVGTRCAFKIANLRCELCFAANSYC